MTSFASRRFLWHAAGFMRAWAFISRSARGWIALAGLLVVSGCASTRPPQGAEPAAYTRIARPNDHTVALQIALRKFTPSRGSGPVLWLAGVSHLGQSNYFAALQRHLDTQQLVLFEGVGGRNRHMRFDPAEESSVQHTLATALGLVFQLSAIDYDRPQFKNSDLTLEELQKLMQGESSRTPAGTNAAPESRELNELVGIMNGSSMMGAIVHLGIRFIGASPKLQAMARLALIETLGRFQGDMAQLKGLPPELQRLMQVLIRSRNEVVIRDLRDSLRRRREGESLAVFYGAGHMPDLEKRLLVELGYRPREDRWLTAISIDTRAAGLSPAEIQTVNELVRWQLEALSP